MVDLATSALGITAAAFIPAFLGLYASSLVRVSRAALLAAFGFGVFLWYFSDTLGGSSYLDVNTGFAGGLSQVGLLALFVVALLLAFVVHDYGLRSEQKAFATSIAVPALVAAALSVHGFGEGISFGTFASAGPPLLLADGISFVLHKALESIMVGACYVAYSRAKASRARLKDLTLLGAIFALPSALGDALGYYLPIDVTYVFAAGVGASAYVAYSLARPIFEARNSAGKDAGTMKLALALLLGFGSIYLAALFHST